MMPFDQQEYQAQATGKIKKAVERVIDKAKKAVNDLLTLL